jgi:hypothetical protein
MIAPRGNGLANLPLARHTIAADGARAQMRFNRRAVGHPRLAIDVGREQRFQIPTISHD